MEKRQIVVIGGGTGTHTVLRGLKQYQKQVSLTAVVTMADSGGSTGRLRDEFGFLPVGDVRMALAALAVDDDAQEELLRELFLYRFDKGEGLSGHNFGNLFLVALTDILGSEEKAIRAAAKVLGVQGRVIPATREKVNLVAAYESGRVQTTEHAIDEPNADIGDERIIDLTITPSVPANPKAVEAILEADLIVAGPGDLYTSVLANCVVPGIAQAIRHSQAPLVYVSNLMTKYGQTNGYGVAEHVAEIVRFTKRRPDYVLVNDSEFPADLLAAYAADKEYPVKRNGDAEVCGQVVTGDFVARERIVTASGDVLKRSLIRHDAHKLAAQLIDLLEPNPASHE
jgi:uncharacterized cofD-like protein